MTVDETVRRLLDGVYVAYQLTIGLLPDPIEIALWVIVAIVAIFKGWQWGRHYFQNIKSNLN